MSLGAWRGLIMNKKFVIGIFIAYVVLSVGALGYYIYNSNKEAASISESEMAEEIAQEVSEDLAKEEAEKEPVVEEEPVEELAQEPVDEAPTEIIPDEKETPPEEASEEDKGEIRPGPYYRYTVKKIDYDSLNLYDDPVSKANILGEIEVGKSGYAIDSTRYRTLIQLEDGSFAFVSKMYLSFTEVPEDEYPEDLKYITLDKAGELFK